MMFLLFLLIFFICFIIFLIYCIRGLYIQNKLRIKLERKYPNAIIGLGSFNTDKVWRAISMLKFKDLFLVTFIGRKREVKKTLYVAIDNIDVDKTDDPEIRKLFYKVVNLTTIIPRIWLMMVVSIILAYIFFPE